MIRILPFLLLLLVAPLALPALDIRDVRISTDGARTRAVIEMTGPAHYRYRNATDSPERTFSVEVSGVSGAPAEPRAIGKLPALTSRRVEFKRADQLFYLHLATTSPVEIDVQRLSSPDRLVFDLTPVGEKSASQPEVKPVSQKSTSTSSKASGGVRTIVIDPGHGGRHRGGFGYTRRPYRNNQRVTLPRAFRKDYGYSRGYRVDEADVTLPIALKLERLLLEDQRFAPALTRRKDEYVSLPERTRRAERFDGDLFLSIHFNAIPENAAKTPRGLEFFTWSPREADSVATRYLQELDNEEGGSGLSGVGREAQSVLNEMMLDALEEQTFASRRVADSFERAFLRDSYFRKYYRGKKSARFRVLQIYNMPSILLEVAFICHPQEAEMAIDRAFQDRVARHIYNGIVDYFERHDPTFPSSAKALAGN